MHLTNKTVSVVKVSNFNQFSSKILLHIDLLQHSRTQLFLSSISISYISDEYKDQDRSEKQKHIFTLPTSKAQTNVKLPLKMSWNSDNYAQ